MFSFLELTLIFHFSFDFTIFRTLLSDSCAYERCPFGQSCSIKEGYTHCNCDINCSGMVEEPVCGETNMKYYKNECELRKEECRTGKRIGISISPCPG